jgi:UDP-3-O-[3-hydroxymyristoyl] glucosamine N-acyltransferase
MSYTLQQVMDQLRDEAATLKETGLPVSITGALPLEEANAESLVWLKPGKQEAIEKLASISCALVICDEEAYAAATAKDITRNFLLVKEPKRIFSKLVNRLFVKKIKPGIHPTAFIESGARIGKDCYIGPFCYVGNATIGDNTILYGHCHIYDNVFFGNNCIIHGGVVIGSDGFGYSKDEAGNVEKFPHIGGVVIGDDVEIGSNTCVDRGALGNTIIHNGVKIDNLVHIAHNVVLHENAFIIANAMLGGSTIVAKGAWVAPSASLLQQLYIGENATIGVGAVVTKNIPAGETWTGMPARPLQEFLLMQKKIKNLP